MLAVDDKHSKKIIFPLTALLAKSLQKVAHHGTGHVG